MASKSKTGRRSDTERNGILHTPSSSPPPSPPPSSSSSLSLHSRRDSGVENDMNRRETRRKDKRRPKGRKKDEKKVKEKEEEVVTNKKEVREEDEIFFNDDEDDPAISAAEMQGYSTMGYFGPVPYNHGVSAQRRKIIQEILAQFDLEQVMERYRGDTVKTSLSKRRFRQWLDRMMGSQEINWNDREWNEKFKQQVLQDFERKQDEKERRLAEAESQRILKLKILGIIRDEEEERRRAEIENRKTVSERIFERRTTKKHQSIFKPNDIETQMEILNRDENEVRQKGRRQKQEEDDNEETESSNRSQSEIKDNDDSPRYESQKQNDTKAVHPNVRDLYQEEDLDRLYREAENLVKLPKKMEKTAPRV